MRILPALLLMTLLCACGQTGELYLPDQKPAAVSPAAPAPAAGEPKKAQKKDAQ